MTGSRIFGPALGRAARRHRRHGVVLPAQRGVVRRRARRRCSLLRRDELHPPPLRAARRPAGARGAARSSAGDRQLLVTFVVMAIVSTFAFNYGVSLPKLADERWGGEDWFGLVLSVTSVGSLIGSLLTARLSWIVDALVPRSTIVLLGVAGVGMAWAPNVGVALVVGRAARHRRRPGSSAPATAITQQESPPDMRGRLLALTAVAFLGSTPIGGPITGVDRRPHRRRVGARLRQRDHGRDRRRGRRRRLHPATGRRGSTGEGVVDLGLVAEREQQGAELLRQLLLLAQVRGRPGSRARWPGGATATSSTRSRPGR